MKKLLIGLMLSALLVFGADDVTVIGNASAVTGTWIEVLTDTTSFHVEDGDVTYEFSGGPWFNAFITSLNAAGDSCFTYISTDAGVYGLSSGTKSVAKAYLKATVGDNSEADTAKYFMGIRDITISPQVGGTADSVFLMEIKAVR